MRLDDALDNLAELYVIQAGLPDGELDEEYEVFQEIINNYRVALAKHYNYDRDCMMWIKGNLDARVRAYALDSTGG